MKAFLVKYKWAIIVWLMFSALVLYFVPSQKNYYLANDINDFRRTSFTSFLIWTGIGISILSLVILLLKTKSVIQSFVAFLIVGITVSFYLFIFQDLFLGTALFFNRQSKHSSLDKVYVANYMAGIAKNKNNFSLFDPQTKQLSNDRKLINKLYNPELKQGDTLHLKLDKGLFGIAFQSKPFSDK